MQAFVNLPINATYTPPTGAVPTHVIRVSIASRGDAVAIDIEDSGSGIAPEDLALVFDPGIEDAVGCPKP